MRPDTLSKLAVSVAICAAAASSVAVGLANSRIDDLEIQRDIYKSRAEDWEGTAGVIAQYADDLADELKIRSKLDEKLDVEYHPRSEPPCGNDRAGTGCHRTEAWRREVRHYI